MTLLSSLWPDIESVARSQGVLRAGASGVEDATVALFDRWLERGDDASMHYLGRTAAVRREPLLRFPWARSVIAITVPYSSERPDAPAESISNRIARYALGDDYHDILDRILRSIEEVILAGAPEAVTRRYVDTGPLSDRSYAAQAGLGWIAKNSMLIDEENGSYLFIGTLLTSLENDLVSSVAADRCGTCTRCIDACPTDAIRPDRTVDSNVCISHATIEQRGVMPEAMRTSLAGNLFGCDICQEACPWNSKSAQAHPAFLHREAYRNTPITDLLKMSQSDFSTLFRRSAIKRAKRAGMARNAILVGACGEIAEDLRDDAGVVGAEQRR
jgi:epoxyqueuosine reductase